MIQYYVLHINPEPWAIGSVNWNRVSPNPNLVAYQTAVKEELEDAEPIAGDQYYIKFLFWRQTARYIDTKDRVRQRHNADTTNLQKGLEDALQGVLFDNDRDVQWAKSVIVAQGPEVEPCIVIEVGLVSREDIDAEVDKLPEYVREKMKTSVPAPSDNRWHGPHSI